MKTTLIEVQRSADKQNDAIKLVKEICTLTGLKPADVRIHTAYSDMRTVTTDADGFEVEAYDPNYHQRFDRIIRNDWSLPKMIGKVIECASTKPTLNIVNVAVLGVKDKAAFELLKATPEYQAAFGTEEESREGGSDVDF